MSKEINLKIQSGPCVGCGETNYPLSMGGPTVCPACDIGQDLKTRLDFYRQKITDLKAENMNLQSWNKKQYDQIEKLQSENKDQADTITTLRKEIEGLKEERKLISEALALEGILGEKIAPVAFVLSAIEQLKGGGQTAKGDKQ